MITVRSSEPVKQCFQMLALRQADVLKGSRDVFAGAPQICRRVNAVFLP